MRTRTETSIGLSVSALETTITGLSRYPSSVASTVSPGKLYHDVADKLYSDLISLCNDGYGYLARVCYFHDHGDCSRLSLNADYNTYW
jgi:hypothetical protein